MLAKSTSWASASAFRLLFWSDGKTLYILWSPKYSGPWWISISAQNPLVISLSKQHGCRIWRTGVAQGDRRDLYPLFVTSASFLSLRTPITIDRSPICPSLAVIDMSTFEKYRDNRGSWKLLSAIISAAVTRSNKSVPLHKANCERETLPS